MSTTPSRTGKQTRTRANPARVRWLLVAAFVAAVAAAAWSAGGARSSVPLDPDNPGPEGARAVAQVLGDEGVDVVVARGLGAFEETAVDASTTVLVTSTDELGPATLARLREHARDAELVLAAPGIPVLEELGVEVRPSRRRLEEPVAAGCADPRFAGLRLLVSTAHVYPGAGCFDTGTDGGGALLHSPLPDVWLLGATEALTNEQVVRGDNAAAALRLLGGRGRLVWYVPSSTDLPGEGSLSIGALLPRWIIPALWLAALSMLALIAWRIRRLGALAVEPLPVSVKAVETTRSRGRLYRRAGDRAHAAHQLRLATRLRLTDAVRLPGAPPEQLVVEVARQSGRPAHEVAALLVGTQPPTTDTDLIGLARALATLEEEVRRT